MTERLLEPLICQKYPRNIQNILNLYFGNFRCFKCDLVILHVQRYFGHNLGFRGFYRSFFLGFKGISVIFQVLEVFQSFFRFREYFGNFLGLVCILVIVRFWEYFDNFFLGFWGILVIVLGFGVILVIFQVLGYFDHFLGFRVIW